MDPDRYRQTVEALPGVTVERKWEDDLVASVAGKMFAVYCDRGAQAGALSFKVPEAEFLAWTERPGLRPAPYLARAHWVQIIDAMTYDEDALPAVLKTAWQIVVARLPKRTQRALLAG